MTTRKDTALEPEFTIRQLPLDSLILDDDIQPRVTPVPADYVDELAESIERKGLLSPLRVFEDEETGERFLSRGFHRHMALSKIQRVKAQVEWRKVEDARAAAWIDARGANGVEQHGILRSAEDLTASIRDLLDDPKWSKVPDQKKADLLGCRRETIVRHRKRLKEKGEMPSVPEIREVTRGGQTFEQKVPVKSLSSSGKKIPAAPLPPPAGNGIPEALMNPGQAEVPDGVDLALVESELIRVEDVLSRDEIKVLVEYLTGVRK